MRKFSSIFFLALFFVFSISSHGFAEDKDIEQIKKDLKKVLAQQEMIINDLAELKTEVKKIKVRIK